MILPGNGCEDILDSNWYSDCKDKIEQLFENDISRKVTVICKDMPDPYVARESMWIPFVEQQLKPYEGKEHCKLVLIGHSSGVSACVTDMGDENERRSGYYNREWNWKSMKENCPTIIQFGSKDDHLVDFETEQVVVNHNLKPITYFYEDKNHFLSYTVDPEIIKSFNNDIIKKTN
ncbi:hypothetical protein FDP41_012517 [Naegleria fowleri]|nr:uncharacterized protein FDP41_012517 [Naegleria fowleri]KAF0981407.1 hypothetical protein FDP41_012517 [Naegleria fowleri]